MFLVEKAKIVKKEYKLKKSKSKSFAVANS